MVNYQPPVDQLLTYGDCRKIKTMPDYLALGLTEKDIPELIRMSIDPELNEGDSDSLEVWAPVHAWRALGQLKAEAAIEPLLNLYHELEDSDWTEELSDVFANIGPAALPYFKPYLADVAHGLYPRAGVVEAIAAIVKKHPESRDEAVAILKGQLEKAEENGPELNAFMIWGLADELKGVEAAALIEKLYEAKQVDRTIVGNWYSVQVAMGLKPPNPKLEDDPEIRREFDEKYPEIKELRKLLARHPELTSFGMDDEPKLKKPDTSRKKAKNKRKMEKESRRRNRKRK